MGKYSKEEYEFERNRQEILSLTQNRERNDEQKAVWAYEIEEFRKQKKREKFMMFGAICGVISFLYLVVSTILNYI